MSIAWCGTTGTLRWLEKGPEGILYWTFTSFDSKVHSYLTPTHTHTHTYIYIYIYIHTKGSIIGGDLNLPQVDWKGLAEGTSLTLALINRLVWDNGYTQVVGKPTRGKSLLDIYVVRLESALIPYVYIYIYI
jgi:hypothetical protein